MLVYSAGGILLNIDRTKLYAVHKTIRNEWLLPKGIIEKGEEPIEAALREVSEETGYFSIKIYDENKKYMHSFSYVLDGQMIEKTVTYFVFQIAQDIQLNTLAMKKEGLTGKWVAPDEFLDLIEGTTTHSLAKVIHEAHDIFRYN